MPEAEMIAAQRVSIQSDLFICLGSSLAVFPAADLPLLAKETDANLIIVNSSASKKLNGINFVIIFVKFKSEYKK